MYTPGTALSGIVIVPSSFTVGVGEPEWIGVITILVIVTLPLVRLSVLPSGFTYSSLSNILGVVRVPVPVTVKPSGRTIGAG